MNISVRPFRVFGRRVSGLFLAKVILSLAVLVSATTISITTTSPQAEFGALLKVANGLIAVDKGFSAAASGSSASGTNCPLSPVLFSVLPGTANTNIIAGDFVFAVQINDTGAPFPATYNVTLVLGSSQFGPLCLRAAVAGGGQSILCKFDVGATLPASPYSFKVTVA